MKTDKNIQGNKLSDIKKMLEAKKQKLNDKKLVKK